jgi:hypothetical protein
MRMDNLLRAYASHRYAILFYSLLITLGAAPLLEALGRDATLLEFFLAVNLLAGALGLEAGWGRRALLILTATALIIHFAFPQITDAVRPAALAFWTTIAMVNAGSSLRFAMQSARIDAEHIYAALSAYLLAGIFFGVLYHAVEGVWPGSFTAGGAVGEFPLFDGIYFSFVTLATLGYGDVLPVSNVARGLAMVEAVSGQLFLAVMIARLVSSYVPTGGRRER